MKRSRTVGGDAQHPGLPTVFRDELLLHCLWLVRPREELLPDPRPVDTQMVSKLAHFHPVDAWAALVLSNSIQRGQQVVAREHALQQAASAWGLGLVCRRRHFLAPRGHRGFTLRPQRELQLPGLLRRCVVETHGPCPLSLVWPFVGASRRGLLRPLLTPRSALRRRPFRRKARSPRVRASTFSARSPDIRPFALTTGASRRIARSPRSGPPRIRFLFVDPRITFHASFRQSVALLPLRFP